MISNQIIAKYVSNDPVLTLVNLLLSILMKNQLPQHAGCLKLKLKLRFELLLKCFDYGWDFNISILTQVIRLELLYLCVLGVPVNLTHKRHTQTTAMDNNAASFGCLGLIFAL